MPDYCCHAKQTFSKTAFAAKSRYSKKSRKQLIQRRKNPKSQFIFRSTLWHDILTEDLEIENYIKKKNNENLPSFDCESKYIQEKLFPTLIPAFERMCSITLKHCAHCGQVRFFNFLDFLAEILWNTNKEHPERRSGWMSIYRVNKNKPFYQSRQFYDYRLFLTADEAATIIQSRVRGHQTRLKYNLEVMRAERAKIAEAAEKQKECFRMYKDIIVNIRDCVYEEDRPNKRGFV